MPIITRDDRIAIAKTRIINILRTYVVANQRTLEQKISDAGPTNQRIDPHLLTEALTKLEQQHTVNRMKRQSGPWFHLAQTPPQAVQSRLVVLEPIHIATSRGAFHKRLGQALEIPVFKALRDQKAMLFFGAFSDLDEHDDGSLYTKIEPPDIVSGVPMQGKLDFMITQPVIGGIEVKNTRPWIYPDCLYIKQLLQKCCAVDAVPILIARRIHYSTFSVLNPCGVLLHETYNQRYPVADQALATRARDKNLLGYHDIRVGNDPDNRLIKFIHVNLPLVLLRSRERFTRFQDLLAAYVAGEILFAEFASRVKRRHRGEPEDLDLEHWDEWL